MNQYGQRKNRAGSEKKTGKALLMIFMGMFAGLLIAVGVAFYISNMPIPFIKQDNPVDDTLSEQIEENQLSLISGSGSDGVVAQNDPYAEQETFISSDADLLAETEVKPADDSVPPLQTKPAPDVLNEASQSGNIAASSRDTTGAPEKTQYDFYTVLPKEGDTTKTAPITPRAEEKPKADRYYLQAGAFKSAQDADNLKASLALMGIEANIQTIIAADQSTIHRVRIGPMHSQADAENIQKRLSNSKISTNLIKVTS